MATQNPYTQPMQPWPGLEAYGKKIHLPSLSLDLFCFEAGDPQKPALVMIHGLGDEADTWRHVILPLSERFHVLAIDLPGFGRSDKPARDYTPDFMQGAILAFMDAMDITHATLMGSSLGAILAHGLALIHPERVSDLILADGALLQQQAMGDRGLQWMRVPLLGEWLYTRLRKNPQAAFDSLRSVYRDLDSLPKADRDFLFTRVNRRVWSDGQRRAYFSTLRKLTPWVKNAQTGLEKQLAALQTPTLVMRGEADLLFPAENAAAVVQTQPSSTLVTLPGAGHLPQQEVPEDFLKTALDWLSQHH